MRPSKRTTLRLLLLLVMSCKPDRAPSTPAASPQLAHSAVSQSPKVVPSSSVAAPSTPVATAIPFGPPSEDIKKSVLKAVTDLPDVRAWCASLRKASQPVSCTIWLEEPPQTSCPRSPSYTDDCLWPVYVGEQQSTHSVRHATFLVNPADSAVLAVDDPGCGLMKLFTWREWKAARAKLPADAEFDCPASGAM